MHCDAAVGSISITDFQFLDWFGQWSIQATLGTDDFGGPLSWKFRTELWTCQKIRSANAWGTVQCSQQPFLHNSPATQTQIEMDSFFSTVDSFFTTIDAFALPSAEHQDILTESDTGSGGTPGCTIA